MGKFSRDKGARRERELVNLFREWGLKALRVPLSGATEHSKGDVDVYPKGEEDASPLILELKARKAHPAYLMEWLGDFDMVAMRSDHEEHLFILPEKTLRKLLT